jgi:hypothetical protein
MSTDNNLSSLFTLTRFEPVDGNQIQMDELRVYLL